jgi:activator of 2-hydroxyglutaryl-CoA dehydratase
VRDAVERKLEVRLASFGAADPQLVGALGAALIANDFALGKAVGA